MRLYVVAITAIFKVVSCCGILTHHEITKQALYFYNSSLTDTLEDYQSFLQAGSFFPDWGYACGSENGSEVAHWQPFWKAGIELLSRKYSRPFSSEAKGLVAFLFGIIGHGVSDVLWHSLGVEQGFIEAMKMADFDGKYSPAHSNADFGGDMAVSRFKDQSHLQGWSIPFDDVLEIYASLNQSVSYTQLRLCTTAAFGLQQLEIGLGKYLFPRFAYRSPFLVENLLTYFRGGISFLATSTSLCWKEAAKWIEAGTINSSCPQMGNASQINNQPSQSMFFSSICVNLHQSLLRKSYSPKVLNIASTSVSWLTSQVCVLSSLPDTERSFSILIASSIKALLFQIWSYITFDTCKKPKRYMTSRFKYSLLGSRMEIGDFDRNGVDEIVFSAPGYDSHSGRVFITSGQIFDYIEDSGALMLGSGSQPTSGFGSGIAIVDWNSDGYDDLAVSSPGLGNGLDQDGGIYIYFGSHNGLSGIHDVFIDGRFNRQPPYVPFPGRKPILDDRMHYFGESLIGIDIDGDGFKDLVVLSPHNTPIVSGAQRGSVHGYLSSSRNGRANLSYLDANWGLTGMRNYELFGTSVTMINKTMLIGAPGFTERGKYTLGAVYAYDFSNPTFPQFQFLWTGEDDFGGFGYHINSNIHGDVLISSPTAKTPSPFPNFMDLPGIIVPGHANGYQGGKVRIRSGVDFKFGDFTDEIVLNGSRSMSHFGKKSLYVNGSWILNEPTVEGERGRLYFGKKCWKGAYHERFGANFLVSGDKIYAYSEMDWARITKLDL